MPYNHKEIVDYNRGAWNREVEMGNQWTVPVSSEEVAAARRGEWRIVLTPTKSVPADWYPQPLAGKDVLCLASGGGQQGPILAAAGASVTVFDNADSQLERDRMVAQRDGLQIRTVRGDMADLSAFADESFDLIVHPVSNIFAPAVRPVWEEAWRVLRRGGVLIAGMTNPVTYIFDYDSLEAGKLVVRHKLPYADETHLSPEEYAQYVQSGEPFEFSHTLEDQLGGQTDAGFLISAFYEDTWPDSLVSQYFPEFFATRAVKL
jgi:SAM-dependent methyltransferase